LVSTGRIDEAASRILREQFDLGLFENPYVSPDDAARTVGRADLRAKGLEVQRQSIVLLQNRENGAGRMLPLRKGTRVYAIGDVRKATIETYGFTVTDGNHAANQPRATAAGYDYAIISIAALNPPAVTSNYKSADPATGANPLLINPITR